MLHAPSRFLPGLSLKRTPLALLLAAALLSGCGRPDETASTAAAPRLVAAQTLKLASSNLQHLTLLSGTVVSSNQVQVASRLMGYIRTLTVREGQTVKAGELLFQVDPTDIEGQVAQARAGLAQAQANFANAKGDDERFGNLYKDQAIPKQQWDQIQLRYQVAQQQVAAAQAGLNTALAQMRYASVTSPIAGVVVQKMANQGDLAAPGRPVLVIEGQGKLQVQTQVPGEVYGKIRIGDTVQMFANGKTLQGIIAQAVPVADPMSHTHTVKIDLPANAGLDSGSFVRVGFPVGSSPQLRVPQAAVVDRAGMTGVFVVDRDGIAHFRLVRLGAQTGDEVEIQAGLSADDTIVTSNLGAVENGVKIGGGNRG
ncbi:efflux RND transporter periplasmic adaptor subunit [Thiomonas sp.]